VGRKDILGGNMSDKFPFTEKTITNTLVLRKFAYNTDSGDLIWHRDREDRSVEVISSKGWMFQFDNELPFEMKDGDRINIKKNSWHRVIKGKGDLIIKIKKNI